MKAGLADQDKTGVAILDRLLRSGQEPLSAEAAKTLLALQFDRRDERRMNQLAAKARRGTLTAAEQAEAEQYNLVSHLIALLQGKARAALPGQASA